MATITVMGGSYCPKCKKDGGLFHYEAVQRIKDHFPEREFVRFTNHTIE